LIDHGAKIKAAVVIGADTAELEALFAKHLPNLPLRVISGEKIMSQAVSSALEFATEGDTVLLAPAAASMDQFQDYADRGNQFQAEVRRQVSK
jgi:UDP-N-acetylmuramoylalanine--D-glutamate ligase